MRIREIKIMIQDAVKDEQETGRLADTVRTVARRNGTRPTQQQIEGVVTFVREYVQQVPFYLEQGIAMARQAGLAREMNQMASELEAYWFEGADFIPDHLGLRGIMDDAYASLSLLQAVSDYCKATTGRPLLAQDISSANQVVRQLIGEPTASLLDQHVGAKLTQALLQKLVSQFASSNFLFGSVGPNWFNKTLEDYELEQSVNTQLGAMGVI